MLSPVGTEHGTRPRINRDAYQAMIKGGSPTIFVTDMARAVAFYTEILGLRLTTAVGHRPARHRLPNLAGHSPQGKPVAMRSSSSVEVLVQQFRQR